MRLFLIFPGPLESKVAYFSNKADLVNYYWPAQAALHGDNPYALWANGSSGEFRSDMAPLELAIYVATVAVWNDPRAIQVLFALVDALNIALLGLVLKSSPARLPFQIFYAVGPLTLYNLVLVPEDKTFVLALTFVIFWLLTLGRDSTLGMGRLRMRTGTLAVIAAAVLAAFKWLSVFYLLPLLLFVSPDLRTLIKNGLAFCAVVAVAHVPWFPSWLYMYAFRSARTGTPLHISPAVLLNAAGLYDKVGTTIVLVLALAVIYALYYWKRLDIFETMAVAVTVGILWTPDMDPVHLSLAVVYFLLVIDWTSGWRQLAIWGLSFWVVGVYAISTHAGYAAAGLPDFRSLTGTYGSVQMILLSYALLAVMLVLYLVDKVRRIGVGGRMLVPDRIRMTAHGEAA